MGTNKIYITMGCSSSSLRFSHTNSSDISFSIDLSSDDSLTDLSSWDESSIESCSSSEESFITDHLEDTTNRLSLERAAMQQRLKLQENLSTRTSTYADRVNTALERGTNVFDFRAAMQQRLWLQENLSTRTSTHADRVNTALERRTNVFDFESERFKNSGNGSIVKLPVCNICLSVFENGQKIRILPCMHMGHRSCVDTWLARNSCCSICRTDILDSNSNMIKEKAY